MYLHVQLNSQNELLYFGGFKLLYNKLQSLHCIDMKEKKYFNVPLDSFTSQPPHTKGKKI